MKTLLALIFAATALFAKVDINNADAKTLETLDGIGAKTAESIIEYRKTNCFAKPEDLTKVKGIGDKTLQKNLQNIEVGACKKK